jgi:hypothetical protein
MNIPTPARHAGMALCIAFCINTHANAQPPSRLVPNAAALATIKFSVRLGGEAEAKACREWMGRMFGEVKETRESTQPGNLVAFTVVGEKLFHPPFKDADALHAAVPASACGKGLLTLSITQPQSADEVRRGLKAL